MLPETSICKILQKLEYQNEQHRVIVRSDGCVIAQYFSTIGLWTDFDIVLSDISNNFHKLNSKSREIYSKRQQRESSNNEWLTIDNNGDLRIRVESIDSKGDAVYQLWVYKPYSIFKMSVFTEDEISTTNKAFNGILSKIHNPYSLPYNSIVVDGLSNQEFLVEKRPFNLSIDLICNIHKMVALHIEEEKRGRIRDYEMGLVPRRESFKLPDALPTRHDPPAKNKDEILMFISDLIRKYEFFKAKVHPLIIGIWIQLELAIIQPFEDGNKAVSRAIMNLYLSSCGLNPISIIFENDYSQAFRNAIEKKHYLFFEMHIKKEIESLKMRQ